MCSWRAGVLRSDGDAAIEDMWGEAVVHHCASALDTGLRGRARVWVFVACSYVVN